MLNNFDIFLLSLPTAAIYYTGLIHLNKSSIFFPNIKDLFDNQISLIYED